jgi:hypothetical protein
MTTTYPEDIQDIELKALDDSSIFMTPNAGARKVYDIVATILADNSAEKTFSVELDDSMQLVVAMSVRGHKFRLRLTK